MWDKDGKVSAWSAPATFEMGLLKGGDWEGRWIGMHASPAMGFTAGRFGRALCLDGRRQTVRIPHYAKLKPAKAITISAWIKPVKVGKAGDRLEKRITRARAYLSGLGWYELLINGKKVGDHVLDPATTDYIKRTLYVTCDVTDRLREGPNAVGVMLGNGWYSEPGRLKYGHSPRVLMRMNVEFADGTVTSVKTDPTWRVAGGPITRNDLYGGETYDARLEKPGWAAPGYDDVDWDHAAIKEAPRGPLDSQLMPAIKVNKTIEPVRLTNPLLNRIHKNVVWTLTNGLFGIPLDCLHREHWAWTDPATVTGMLYPRKHMPLFWTKWLADISDARQESGAVPDVAPSYTGNRSDPAWGGGWEEMPKA